MNAKKQKKKLRRIALALLVLMLLVAVIGVLVRGRQEKKAGETQTFENGSGVTQMEMLASFPEFGTDVTIGYHDETVSQTEPTGETHTEAAASGETSASSTAASSSSSTAETSVSSTAAAGSTVHDYSTGDAYAYAYAGYTPQTANLDIADWRLLLVNRNYMLPQDYSPALAEAVKGSGVRMDARVAPYYQKMYDAAKADGITLTPLSGHRRISTQKRNFDNKIQYYMNQGYDKATATQKAAQIILPPGTSEHNAGMSMDIISLEVSFEQTKAFAWLKAHAADYGFILRYPKDKESITEITYEPWHWRYVGVENAKAMNQSGQCLEEYVGAVR